MNYEQKIKLITMMKNNKLALASSMSDERLRLILETTADALTECLEIMTYDDLAETMWRIYGDES